MHQQPPFKWRHFEAEIILLSVRSLPALSAQLPRSRRDAAGTRNQRRSHDPLSVGTALRPSELRQVKYLNSLIEQDHRFIKRLVKPGLGFFALTPPGGPYKVMK